MKFRDYVTEVIKGKSVFTGKAGKKKVKMSQEKNGMYHGEIRDEFGDIESATTKKTSQDVKKWFSQRGIKNIKWD